MERNRVRIINELEGLVEFITCPEYIKDALALIKELTEENERWQAVALKQEDTMQMIAQEKQTYYDELQTIKADTVRKVQDRFAFEIGTYTSEDTVKVVDVFKILAQIEKEVLEGDK